MNEAKLKGELCKEARATMRGYVVLRHEDHFTHGIPDITFTGHKHTSWVEAKYANPHFKVKGIQELTMKRLALAGLAFFVVYWENKGERKTCIIHPDDIAKPLEESPSVEGFDHTFVIEYIKRTHQ